MTPALSVRHLSKSFGSRAAVVDASFSVQAGEFVAVLGASGSGKTTLFRCLTRLTEPDDGEIEIGGEVFHTLRGKRLAAARRRMGLVFQQFNLIRRLSALENALAGRLGNAPLWRVMLRTFSADDVMIAADALREVGLGEHLDQRADTLSGGQQQRVAIARAIAQRSRVILADEPVASLDPETALSILELLHALTRTSGVAVICTLHQPQLAQRFADRILTMNAGRLSEFEASECAAADAQT